PLHAACVQPAPKSRFVVPGLLRYGDQKLRRVLRCSDSTPQSLNEHKACVPACWRMLWVINLDGA
ncbi:hypothetical protein, partial [Pseudomonas abietaniphila]|uniref:hypothetical protein n=1 Tax=Pseudomonas abietaniphila TaxID=89065 RepID=UPI001EE7739C